MARRAAVLTARRVQTEKSPGLYADGGGLYLQVAPTGAKTWIYRFQLAGRRRDMGLGSAGVYSLAEAREKAAAARRLVAERIDPIEEKARLRASATLERAKAMAFRECAKGYLDAHRNAWRNLKHRAQWEATLDSYVYPVFGGLPVQEIDVGLVMRAVEPIWSRKPETASRVRGRIETILDWATARGYRTGENPARWRGHLDKLLPRSSAVKRAKRRAEGRDEHHAALPYTEIGSFIGELRRRDAIAARGLEFAILTAARTGEVIGARFAEISRNERIWTVPAERMKSGREHRVPLSAAALAIVDAMAEIRQSDYVFAGQAGQPLSNMAFLMLLRRMGRNDLTAHGFRSTFRDWAAERTNFPSEVAEMALAHAVGDKVEAAYRRGDLFQKRRELAEAWARYCAEKATPTSRYAPPCDLVLIGG